jgi:LysR family transcriptional activator of nhaA
MERRLTHPAVIAITDTAHRELFASLNPGKSASKEKE